MPRIHREAVPRETSLREGHSRNGGVTFGDTQELKMLRESVRRAARDKIAPLAASIDEQGVFNRDVEDLCWELGLS